MRYLAGMHASTVRSKWLAKMGNSEIFQPLGVIDEFTFLVKAEQLKNLSIPYLALDRDLQLPFLDSGCMPLVCRPEPVRRLESL